MESARHVIDELQKCLPEILAGASTVYHILGRDLAIDHRLIEILNEMRLRSRAYVIASPCNGKRVAFVSADLAMPTSPIVRARPAIAGLRYLAGVFGHTEVLDSISAQTQLHMFDV